MMVPQKMNGESDLQYHRRLVEGKLVDKTLSDVDYSELSVALYGQPYSSDFTRRMMYGSKATLALLDAAEIPHGANSTADIDEKIRMLREERYKLNAAKLEVQRAERADSRCQLFYEQIKDAMERIPMPALEVPEQQYCYDYGRKKWVLGLGDIHYGANFKSANNTYSREECKRRFAIAADAVKQECVHNGIANLTVINVADSIQGILRLSDLHMNDISVVDCVVEVSRLIATFLSDLSAFCKIDYYHIPSANHSQTRPLGSKASEIATEDLERLIVNYISDLLAYNDRVNVIQTCGKDYVEFDVADFHCIAMHGHQIKDTSTCIEHLSTLHRKMYDYVFLGHKHASNEQIIAEGKNHNVEVLTCPSFVGSDPYSDRVMRGSKAMVKLYEFDSEYGHIGSKNIILN